MFLLAVVSMAVFARSPFGASLAGTRDQARRMTALGYNVWLIRFLAILFSGFWTGVAGLLFLYYNQFVSPQVAALTTSAEALLMVISGGSGTLLGPIVGAAIVVDHEERGERLHRALEPRARRDLHPHHQLHAGGPGAGLGAAVARRPRQAICGSQPSEPALRPGAGARAMTALAVTGLCKSFGGLRVTANVDLAVEPGERRLIIGPNGAGKTTLFNLITGEIAPDSGSIALFGRDITRARLPPPRPSRAWRAPTRSSRCSRATPSCATSRWRCWASRRCAGTRSRDLDRAART